MRQQYKANIVSVSCGKLVSQEYLSIAQRVLDRVTWSCHVLDN